MKGFSDLLGIKAYFEDFYFRADSDSLTLYVVDGSGCELEILFSPVPLCYRYTVEECRYPFDTTPQQMFQLHDRSCWREHEKFSGLKEFSAAKKFTIVIGGQVFEALSEREPRLSWGDNSFLNDARTAKPSESMPSDKSLN